MIIHTYSVTVEQYIVMQHFYTDISSVMKQELLLQQLASLPFRIKTYNTVEKNGSDMSLTNFVLDYITLSELPHA